ncbi:ribonuclease kappa isoform X2 [Canis lupus dingo]|uniref:ribonuclease kappa isoform X2 n=1 Tax=Canis lupus dingo TaxID=286419 RepID=UPI0020C4235F|nr:ribonuclease kappa isoform X2 [Canis lupus dingo]
MASLLCCGPKLAACGIVLSAWGVIIPVTMTPLERRIIGWLTVAALAPAHALILVPAAATPTPARSDNARNFFQRPFRCADRGRSFHRERF